MKQIITILTLSLGLFAFTASAQTSTVYFPDAPTNFSKIKFKQMLYANGLTRRAYKQIGGMNAVINSLQKKNGLWSFSITESQKAKLVQFTNGAIQFDVGQIGPDEFGDVILVGTNT